MSKHRMRGFLVVAGIALRAPLALADVTVPSPEARAAPVAAADACRVMQLSAAAPPSSGDEPVDETPRHLADRRMEQAIRQFYAQHVLAAGIDRRSMARRPPTFRWAGPFPGTTVGPCVESWRTSDPEGSLPTRPPRIAADHRYAEIHFYLARHGEGDLEYETFVDVVTKQVVAMFYWVDNTP